MRGRVLVVDDDGDLRESLVELLGLWGLEAHGASNGREALEVLGRMAALPCLILLDLTMPVMSGEEFRAVQRADPQLAGIPVIVFSANADVEARAAALGISGVLAKPVSASALEAALAPYFPDPQD